MAVLGNLTAVQTDYFDQLERLYPGQLAEGRSLYDFDLRGFPGEGEIICGRGLVIGTAIDESATVYVESSVPYSVKLPEVASVLADFVGIAVRDTTSTNTDQTNFEASYIDGQMVPVASYGSGIIIGAKASVAIAHGDPVWMAVNPVNDANIAVGEFHNVTGAGLIEITNAIWWGNALADTTGRIKI